jgi:putative ABC transport system permease protein
MKWNARRSIDDAWRHVAYAVRSLARQPAFTAAIVLTLSIGVGATSTIYSVVRTVLFQPLPLTDADRVVRIVENDRPRSLPQVTYREYLEWHPRVTTMSGMAALAENSDVVMPAPAGLVKVNAAFVSANYFELLGARSRLGRALLAGDAESDVMVLGYSAWQRHFASDAQVIGSVISFRSSPLAGRSLTVVGVMPESMETLNPLIDFYLPIATTPNAGTMTLARMLGRLRDGVSASAASEEANAIGVAIRPPRPASAPPLSSARFEVRSLEDGLFDPRPGSQVPANLATIRTVLRFFLAAVVVLLLIVCANVSHLLLARGTARRRELATRLALGASRSQLLREMLAECLVLAAAGGMAGTALAAAGVSATKWLATLDTQGTFRTVFGTSILPRTNELVVDGRMLGTALVVSLIAMLASSLLPALHLSLARQLDVLGSRSAAGTRRDTRVRMALVVGQLAMATVLLVGGGLLITSFGRLATVDKGYNPTNVVAFQLVLPDDYPTARKAESIEGALSALRSMPSVAAAGFAYAGILIGIQDTVGSFVPPGRSLDAGSKDVDRPRIKSLSAGYLEAAGATLLEGRLIADSDSAAAPTVAVINLTVKSRYFGEASPVGAFMEWHGGSIPIPVQIIGVIADVRQRSLDRDPYPEIFIDYRQVMAVQERWGAPNAMIDRLGFGVMSFAVRTRHDSAGVIPAVRQAINRVDPNAALDAIMPMERLVAISVARQRFYALMLLAFASVAAALAAVGIYGVLAYVTVERTREIALRMALGARPRQVVALVLGRGLSCAALGIVLGLAGAAASARYLRAMLFGITPLDGDTFVIVAVAFAAMAALASYLPARRAAQVDPMVALRIE